MPDRLIWHGAWKGEKKVKTIYFKGKQTLCLCIVACDDLYFFIFVRVTPWSLCLWHSWSLCVFFQAQCLWHQVLLFMASQPQDQAVHKTWVSFQALSFIISIMFIERDTYTAASIASGSNPLRLCDSEAVNWSVGTAASWNNFMNWRGNMY